MIKITDYFKRKNPEIMPVYHPQNMDQQRIDEFHEYVDVLIATHHLSQTNQHEEFEKPVIMIETELRVKYEGVAVRELLNKLIDAFNVYIKVINESELIPNVSLLRRVQSLVTVKWCDIASLQQIALEDNDEEKKSESNNDAKNVDDNKTDSNIDNVDQALAQEFALKLKLNSQNKFMIKVSNGTEEKKNKENIPDNNRKNANNNNDNNDNNDNNNDNESDVGFSEGHPVRDGIMAINAGSIGIKLKNRMIKYAARNEIDTVEKWNNFVEKGDVTKIPGIGKKRGQCMQQAAAIDIIKNAVNKI